MLQYAGTPIKKEFFYARTRQSVRSRFDSTAMAQLRSPRRQAGCPSTWGTTTNTQHHGGFAAPRVPAQNEDALGWIVDVTKGDGNMGTSAKGNESDHDNAYAALYQLRRVPPSTSDL